MARVMDPSGASRAPSGPSTTRTHDRVAVACAGRGIITTKQLNFGSSFYRVETAFLLLWEGNVCGAVETGEYEEIYARFLTIGFMAAMNIKGGEQTTDEADELIASCRAGEIGEEALGDEAWEKDGHGHGRELLQKRFMEMHRNKSLCAVWRRKNHVEKMKTMMMQNQQRQQQQQIQMQQQQVHLQQRQQIHMQQKQQQIQQQQIQMQQQRRRQQQFQQHQMMIQKQRQQQLTMAQQQEQQYLDDNAICSLDSGEIVNNQIE
nr:uncharacterized protein LOC127310803 [Lolium perenne]